MSKIFSRIRTRTGERVVCLRINFNLTVEECASLLAEAFVKPEDVDTEEKFRKALRLWLWVDGKGAFCPDPDRSRFCDEEPEEVEAVLAPLREAVERFLP